MSQVCVGTILSGNVPSLWQIYGTFYAQNSFSSLPDIMTLLIFNTIRQSWVANINCCRFPISGSMTNASFMSLLPVCMQSTPSLVFFSVTCRLLMLASVSIGERPEFSARAMGIASSASANARIAYCSRPGDLTAASSTAREQAISAAPPP